MSTVTGEELSQDAVFDILSNSRRRFLLSRLQQRGEPVALVDLADEIAAWENDTTVDELTDKQSKRVYVSVYQTHVPKLESTGLIEYDSESGLIELTQAARQINGYMPEGDDDETPWHLYYAGLAISSALFYVLVAAEVAIFGALSLSIAGILIVSGFVALSVTHYVRSKRNGQRVDEIPVSNGHER